MKRHGITFLLITHILLITMPCLAGERKGAFSLSPFLGGYSFDGTQHLRTEPVYGLRLGYDISKNWATEGVFAYVATSTTQQQQDVNVYSYRLDMLYNLLADTAFVPYLAMGGGWATKDPDHGTQYTDMTFNFGGGLKYFFTDSLALRGDVRQLLVFADKNVNNWEYSVGLSYLFGGEKPAPALAKTEPVVKPAAETELKPEPVTKPATNVAPIPAPTTPLKPVSATESTSDATKNQIALNILFYIDTAIILDESRDEIGKVAAIMKESPKVMVVFEGHDSDTRIPEYNIHLSQRRVESVVNYLVEKFGIERSRIAIKGYGETRPNAKFRTPGRQENKRSVNVIFDCVIKR